MADTNSFLWQDGILRVNLPRAEMRIRWAPKPLAEERNIRGEWKQCWPTFRLLRPVAASPKPRFELDLQMARRDAELLRQKTAAFDAFRASIPPEIGALVERFGSHQWNLLEMLGREQAAVDLAKSNLVLAYALANNAELRGTDPKPAAVQALCHCQRKQRWIAHWLGFPDSAAMVKLLQRIIPEDVYPSQLRRLKYAMEGRFRVMGLLAHQKSINAGVLDLVGNPHLAPLVTAKLLAEIAGHPDAELAGAIAAQLLRALELLQQLAPGRPVRPFTRIAQAREFGAAVAAEYIERERWREAGRPAAAAGPVRQRRGAKRPGRVKLCDVFPPPPVPGIAEIIPIRNLEDLRAEGMAQHNCVGSYDKRIRKGETFIYKVLYPERATLSIVRGPDGCWHREELKKMRNRPVRQSTKTFVDNWLAKHLVSG
jgi:hypothetical protein